MPKKIIKNWLYGAKDRLRLDYPRWLQPFLDHPNLFHLNRNSISRAVGIGIFCAFIPLPYPNIDNHVHVLDCWSQSAAGGNRNLDQQSNHNTPNVLFDLQIGKFIT